MGDNIGAGPMAAPLRCDMCPHRCLIAEGRRGLCLARGVREGKLTPVSYGFTTSLALDPIEKKPFRHFYPGSFILSMGSFGCNMRCKFCQNHSISYSDGEGALYISPEELADKALELAPHGNIGLAYTYNEPLINYEFISDTARLVRERGLKNALVTNGMLNEDRFLELLPLIDAANIDYKSHSAGFYREHGGDIDTVRRSVELAAGRIHTEITTLVIEGINDDMGEFEEGCRFLASVSEDMPLHVTRFYPRYKMIDRPPTTAKRVEELKAAAHKYLKFVY